MSDLIKERPPVEAQQYISVEEAVGEYSNYYLTVNHEADRVDVWLHEYGSTLPDIDRSFKLSEFAACIAWLRDTAEDGETKEQPLLGEWQKDEDGDCILLLPCGDSIETSVANMERLAFALAKMSSVTDWGGVPR